MDTIIFIICMVAVTVYLTVAAIEDYKTCEVTRWKHLLGFVPGFFYFVWNAGKFGWTDVAVILGFIAIFIGAGLLRVYGLADGFVLANLTLMFGGIGGAMGAGMVVLIMVLASFSFLVYRCICDRITIKRLMKDKGAAFIPHVIVGYVVIGIEILCKFF